MRNLLLLTITILASSCSNKAKVDTSLAWKNDKLQTTEIKSSNAIEYKTVLHHGPAVENEFYALRLYFNNSGAIDVYNKSQQRLELGETAWYPDSIKQVTGYGCDQYKVGSTLGLGGIALWDGENIVKLEATEGRTAKVSKTDATAKMEMVAHGVSYNDEKIDVSICVELQAGNRWANITATTTSSNLVQFVTGVNYHNNAKTLNEDGAIVAWGVHPEDVAFNPGNIGAAISYNASDFVEKKDLGNEFIVISKPMKSIETQVTTVSVHESEINTFDKLCDFALSNLE